MRTATNKPMPLAAGALDRHYEVKSKFTNITQHNIIYTEWQYFVAPTCPWAFVMIWLVMPVMLDMALVMMGVEVRELRNCG